VRTCVCVRCVRPTTTPVTSAKHIICRKKCHICVTYEVCNLCLDELVVGKQPIKHTLVAAAHGGGGGGVAVEMLVNPCLHGKSVFGVYVLVEKRC
jgi:hypothetical protein